VLKVAAAGLARIGTGCETALHDPVGPVGGARCRPGSELKVEETHSESFYRSSDPESSIALTTRSRSSPVIPSGRVMVAWPASPRRGPPLVRSCSR